VVALELKKPSPQEASHVPAAVRNKPPPAAPHAVQAAASPPVQAPQEEWQARQLLVASDASVNEP
jgi:hypothetical protein